MMGNNCFHTSDAEAGKQEGAILHLSSYFSMSKHEHLFQTTLFVPKKNQKECRGLWCFYLSVNTLDK